MTHDSTKDGTCQDIEKRSLVVDVRERGRKEIKKIGLNNGCVTRSYKFEYWDVVANARTDGSI